MNKIKVLLTITGILGLLGCQEDPNPLVPDVLVCAKVQNCPAGKGELEVVLRAQGFRREVYVNEDHYDHQSTTKVYSLRDELETSSSDVACFEMDLTNGKTCGGYCWADNPDIVSLAYAASDFETLQLTLTLLGDSGQETVVLNPASESVDFVSGTIDLTFDCAQGG